MGWGWNGASRLHSLHSLCVCVCMSVCLSVFSVWHVSTCRFCFHSSPRVGLLLLMLAVLTQIVSTALLTNINGNMLRSADLVLSSVTVPTDIHQQQNIPLASTHVSTQHFTHLNIHRPHTQPICTHGQYLLKYPLPTYTTYIYTRPVFTEISTATLHDLYTHGQYLLKNSPPPYTTYIHTASIY